MTGIRGRRGLKAIDRYLGIPAVASFALLPKRKQPAPESVRRIGLLKSAAIGDTLLLAGLADDVWRAFPNAELVAITGAANRSAAELVFPNRSRFVEVSPTAPFAAIRTLRALDLDIIVDFGSWPRFDAAIASLSGARYRVGFRTPGQWRHAGFDCAVLHSNDRHERENYAALITAIGIRAVSVPELPVVRRAGDSALFEHPFVIFHAWSSGYMGWVKEWSLENWTELAARLNTRGWRVLLTGDTRERARTEELADRIRRVGATVTNGAGVYSLAELCEIVRKSEAVVSVNTGIAHLAGLAGARTVSLEGPTPTRRWCPLGPRVMPVVTTTPGSGYLNLGFEYSGNRLDCMNGIEVSAVARAIDELIARDGAAPVRS
jgi:heptosyltransferase I